MSIVNVGGLVKFTTIDYPGKIAAVVFLQGCGWRCHYCHNKHLFSQERPPGTPGWKQVVDFLERRAGLLDAVVFSGGEPTLQGGLYNAACVVSSMGYSVGLHTNGAYPARIERLLGVVDWIGLDIKAKIEDYPAITGVKNSGMAPRDSLKLISDSGTACQVRITQLPDWEPGYVDALIGEIRAIAPDVEIKLQTYRPPLNT